VSFEPDIPVIQVQLCVRRGRDAIAWYERAFGAVETFAQLAEDGERVLHANLSVFGSEIMLHDELPDIVPDVLSPESRGGAGMTVTVNVPSPIDVDRVVRRAVAAGAVITMPVVDQGWGARYGRIRDPFGHVWAFSAALKGRQ
jgi:PhnB protein